MTPAGGKPMGLDHELLLLLAGSISRREHSRERIAELAARADLEQVVATFQREGLLTLLGSRLIELMPPGQDVLRDRVADSIKAECAHAATVEQATTEACAALETEGIVALPLEGPLLTRRAHGRPGLGDSPNVDILVAKQDLAEAVRLLVALGYSTAHEARWEGDLPLLHETLRPSKAWLPTLEVHWRVHWYETGLSGRLLDHSFMDGEGIRRPRPADELALLLVLYARSGLYGMRWPADLAAWWDRFGSETREHALAGVIEDHPSLGIALNAAVLAAERLVGAPPASVLTESTSRSARAESAARLASWRRDEADVDVAAQVTLIDLMLSPPSGLAPWVSRHLFQPSDHVAHAFRLDPRAHAKLRLRGLVHGSAATARFSPRFARALWNVRGGRTVTSLEP